MVNSDMWSLKARAQDQRSPDIKTRAPEAHLHKIVEIPYNDTYHYQVSTSCPLGEVAQKKFASSKKMRNNWVQNALKLPMAKLPKLSKNYSETRK